LSDPTTPTPRAAGDVPAATVVKAGKLGGDVPRPGGAGRHKRKLSNYLLDKELQLRYVIVVTMLSAIIAGALGTLIYRQEHKASAALEQDLQALTGSDPSLADFQRSVVHDMEAGDRALVFEMVGVGVGLIVILSGYLVVMTHKVAGPLYKVTLYFDKMADGKLGRVTALRKGDMLQDFYVNFREMHEAVRGRMVGDVEAMERAITALRAAAVTGAVAAEVAALEAHVAARKQQLA
jgi:hypothetical protein